MTIKHPSKNWKLFLLILVTLNILVLGGFIYYLTIAVFPMIQVL